METSREPPIGLLEFYENSLDFGRKAQSEHSKWLINTLYLLHSGSIAGLLYRVPANELGKFACSISWFIAGVAFAFLAGLGTWANYHWFNRAYSDLIQSIRRNEWQPGKRPRSANLVALTQWVALAIGFVSFGCLILGARLTLKTLVAPH
jgi:hypothetical protein